ncbi:Haloalkane dehalogenase-like protein [Serinicoccus hydrothermalis]|uniref:Haloalkane dehalogenase-like protein n=1 Tax=Serinicoccus hydrothermalis TaxID=1758689 RepID=A0A1B1NBB2_9MICO|nr:alpha/beta fold hydrolase [Serinicoccus hydrothermalis]ANS78716.1 Haloalkane dehalogenase-like protein [Serinicoccus hydrothermalis]
MDLPQPSPRHRIQDPARRAAHDRVGLPSAPLPGLDPDWSRVVVAADAEGRTRRWHVLDNGPALEAAGAEIEGTVLAVHGNPTWSYLWRRVLAQAPLGWRVVAVDQLGMGWSERPGTPRTLPQRVADLGGLTDALGLTRPVVTLAHDWGGPISLGWALAHRDELAGVVLTNTAVHQPVEHAAPAVIRLARAPALLAQVCRTTPAFVRATTALSRPALPRDVRDAFAAPYASAARRDAVADFVRDIPFEPDHPSRATLDEIAAGTATLDVPALLVWGPRDPVFSQRYLEDLVRRLPHADVQVYPGASHLVLEDRPEGVGVVWDWVRRTVGGEGEPRGAEAGPRTTAAAQVPVRVDTGRPDEVAIVELGGAARSVTFGELDARVDAVARGLAGRGVRTGDRVAVLVPPGVDLTTVVYAVWRLGAVVVVADAGLGLARLGAALAGAGPAHVVGIGRALALAAVTRVPGSRIRTDGGGLDALADEGARLDDPLPEDLDDGADGAILFTSGATGPPKGVVYTRRGLGAQVALLRDTFGFGPGERFVAAFAPFALYGPALGLPSAVPDMDVTAPHTLTATGLADAVAAVDATMVFAAPAALRNVVATAGALDAEQRAVLGRVRLVLSAGAPVPPELLREVRQVLPAAQTQTPYGMTEALPVATHDPTTLSPEDLAGGSGVCVGRPVPGVEVAIAALGPDGIPAEDLATGDGTGADVVGEIVVRGPHVKDRYDRRWAAQEHSDRPAGWHRTGDVGHLDGSGRLWVEGRLAHVVTTAEGPVTPYPVEDRVRDLPGVADVAVVGVGPAGAQLVVLVLVRGERGGPVARATGAAHGSGALAPPELAARARAAAGVPVAAVLVRDWLPVDVRHASKVDRSVLAGWADGVLHGRPLRDRLRSAVGMPGQAPRRAPHRRSR